jgi:hypothetical protein
VDLVEQILEAAAEVDLITPQLMLVVMVDPVW